jgi:hypothetical protein
MLSINTSEPPTSAMNVIPGIIYSHVHCIGNKGMSKVDRCLWCKQKRGMLILYKIILHTYSAQYRYDFSRKVAVEFIGVFDTVAVVGTMFRKTLPFPGNNHMVKTFRHAMSLDEHRSAYHPRAWQRSIPDKDVVDTLVKQGRQRIGIFRSLFTKLDDTARTLTAPVADEDPALSVAPLGKVQIAKRSTSLVVMQVS